MVLVDTSVWIDFLQDPDSRHAAALEALILENNRAVICGIILQEILQGIRDEKKYALTRDVFPGCRILTSTRKHISTPHLSIEY